MDLKRVGGFRVRPGSLGPATEVLSHDGIERLVDDALVALAVLKQQITPERIRGYVEINVELGRYLAPTAEDLRHALQWRRLEDRRVLQVEEEAEHERSIGLPGMRVPPDPGMSGSGRLILRT